jgi:hypothetical protein
MSHFRAVLREAMAAFSSPLGPAWHPYETSTDTVMRRFCHGRWQTRRMTHEELQAHFESGIAWWLENSPELHTRAPKA